MPTRAEYQRVRRVQDFARRIAAVEVSTLPECDAKYLTIHPCADEEELLQRIDYPAERCVSVDLYWSFGGDVSFVQVHAEEFSLRKAPGIYARLLDNEVVRFNIVAIISARVVKRGDVEQVLRCCIAAGFSGQDFGTMRVGSALTRIAALDGDGRVA